MRQRKGNRANGRNILLQPSRNGCNECVCAFHHGNASDDSALVTRQTPADRWTLVLRRLQTKNSSWSGKWQQQQKNVSGSVTMRAALDRMEAKKVYSTPWVSCVNVAAGVGSDGGSLVTGLCLVQLRSVVPPLATCCVSAGRHSTTPSRATATCPPLDAAFFT